MNLIPVHAGRRALRSALSLIVLALALPAFTALSAAQEKPAPNQTAANQPAPNQPGPNQPGPNQPGPNQPGLGQPADVQANPSADSTRPKPDFGSYRSIYLTNVTSDHDAQEIVTDLRNMLPQARIYYVSSQRVVSIEGSAGDIQSAQKMISEIDRPLKTFRLTFSFTELEGDKPVSTQKVALLAVGSGEKAIFKQGSKVPIVTGTSGEGNAQSSQVQYVDVGLTIEAAVDGSPDTLRLRTKIEQSSVPEERASSATGDPAIRQTTLEAGAALVPGKPLVLGSLDIPGSTRREEVSVVSEPVE
jgi:hypothetical protein